jgi:hypothetical protein
LTIRAVVVNFGVATLLHFLLLSVIRRRREMVTSGALGHVSVVGVDHPPHGRDHILVGGLQPSIHSRAPRYRQRVPMLPFLRARRREQP